VIKTMFFLYKRSDFSVDEFLRHSKEVHVPIVARVPRLRRYVVNHTAANPFGAEQVCDAVAELWFDSISDFQEALSTLEGKNALADQPNYLDMNRTHMLVVDEATVV
jgi:uncharacterized protein (TIGR02118 family)